MNLVLGLCTQISHFGPRDVLRSYLKVVELIERIVLEEKARDQ